MSRIKRIGRTFTACVGKGGTIGEEDEHTTPKIIKLKEKAEDKQELLDLPESRADEFYERVRRDAVAVEYLDHTSSTITGYVSVRNDAPDKCVTVRYTTNGWETQDEICAEWLESTNNQSFDKFRFSIPCFKTPYTVHLAVRYDVLDQQYWDNNNHENYVVHGQESNKSKS